MSTQPRYDRLSRASRKAFGAVAAAFAGQMRRYCAGIVVRIE
jgi:hypothetical protein